MSAGNCPGSTVWPSNIVIQRASLILDLAGTPAVGFNPLSVSVTVQNSNILCNTTQTCNSSVLGSGITNGTGNTFNTRGLWPRRLHLAHELPATQRDVISG